MAKLQQKSKLWYESLNDARGYKSSVSKWPLWAAGLAAAIAVILTLILTV